LEEFDVIEIEKPQKLEKFDVIEIEKPQL